MYLLDCLDDLHEDQRELIYFATKKHGKIKKVIVRNSLAIIKDTEIVIKSAGWLQDLLRDLDVLCEFYETPKEELEYVKRSIFDTIQQN